MNLKRSALIIPLSVLAHLAIIHLNLLLLTPDTYLQWANPIYYTFSWLLVSGALNYYPTKRKEKFFTNIHKMFNLYTLFGLCYIAIFGFGSGRTISNLFHIKVLTIIFLFLTFYRVFFYWAIGTYRSKGGNSVRVVAIGTDKNLKKIRKVFDNPRLGYRYKGFFDDRSSKSPTYLVVIRNAYSYIIQNEIDEVYCLASKFSQSELRNLIDFADNDLIRLKIIPDNKEVFTLSMSLEMYDSIPVFNIRRVPLDMEYAKWVKRVFDIIFLSFVMIFVLSWLLPVMLVLIKLESSGPFYFKQKRHGLKKNVFWCYKFRSIAADPDCNSVMATKNDMRVTRVGKFIRKTSIDELPQFFNVFLGNMSVVGPRPHMEKHTQGFENSVDKYLVRHFVKPGITGLAQISGYSGEILKHRDILNRIKLDIFYVEKWSFTFDLNIIYRTVYNVFSGEEKAYWDVL